MSESQKRKYNSKSRVREKLCIGCRELRPKQQLLRIVRTPEGQCVIDYKGKTAGRGAYICPNTDCLKMAQKNKSLAKSLRCVVTADVYGELAELVRKREELSAEDS